MGFLTAEKSLQKHQKYKKVNEIVSANIMNF